MNKGVLRLLHISRGIQVLSLALTNPLVQKQPATHGLEQLLCFPVVALSHVGSQGGRHTSNSSPSLHMNVNCPEINHYIILFLYTDTHKITLG